MLTVKTEILCSGRAPKAFTGRQIESRNGVYQKLGDDAISRFVIHGDLMLLVQSHGYCSKLNIEMFYNDKFVDSYDKVIITFE